VLYPIFTSGVLVISFLSGYPSPPWADKQNIQTLSPVGDMGSLYYVMEIKSGIILGQSHLEYERIAPSNKEAQSDGKPSNGQSDQAF
jgi:hypothetical protein